MEAVDREIDRTPLEVEKVGTITPSMFAVSGKQEYRQIKVDSSPQLFDKYSMGLTAAVIGTGSQYGLGREHAAVYDLREEVGQILLCDRVLNSAEDLARSIGKPVRCFSAVTEMFEQATVNLVSILTPDYLHREHAELAFAHGSHVLLTKPLAPTLEDARGIITAADRAGRKLMIAHERRFQAESLGAKELIEAGRLGELAYVGVTEFYQRVKEKFANAPWYGASMSGRTMVTGSGIHQVDLIRHLVGAQVMSVTAQGNQVGDIPFHHNKTVAALFRFTGTETLGNLIFSYEGMPNMTRGGLVVIGSRGMISLGKFRDRQTGEEIDLAARKAMNSHQACVHQFLDAVCHDKGVPITGEEGFASLAAAVAIDRSCATGKSEAPQVLRE